MTSQAPKCKMQNCAHLYIRDWIDITPEDTQMIIYCKYCMTSAPDDYRLPICESEPVKLPPRVESDCFSSGDKQSAPLEFDNPLLLLKQV